MVLRMLTQPCGAPARTLQEVFMVRTIDNSVVSLTQMMNVAGKHDRIVANEDGTFKTVGRFGSLFTSKATCRASAEAFLGSIRTTYGDSIADSLSPQLRTTLDRGRSLKARNARDILQQAATLSQEMSRANADLARHFLLGGNIHGDTHSLDHALDQFCTANHLQPSPAMRQCFERVITQLAASSQKLLTSADLARTVNMQTLQSHPADYLRCGIDPQINRDSALDACAARLGIAGDMKNQLGQLMDRMLEQESASGRQITPAALFQELASAEPLPLQCFATACDKATLQDATLREAMNMTPHAHVVDMATLAPQLRRNGNIGLMMTVMQRLPEMRNQQPQGPLSRETLWQGCFHEAMPQNLADADQPGFNRAMSSKLQDMFMARTDDPAKAFNGMLLLGAGVSLETALASIDKPTPLTFRDIAIPPRLTALTRLGDMQRVESQIAIDLCRRGTQHSVPGYSPTISFGGHGVPAEAVGTVHIQATGYMEPDDRKSFESGKPSSMSANLATRARQLCGSNDVQARQVILNMGQAGAFLMRSVSLMTGVLQDEHSPLDIDIRREGNGNVTMRYHTPPQSRLDADFTYTITPDGQGVLTACRMQARQPQDA